MKKRMRGLISSGLRVFLIVAVVMASFGSVLPVKAADTVTIGLTQNYINGNTRPDIVPGTTICLAPGNRTMLKFINIHGTATNWITIKNCGGQVTIGGGLYGLSIENSSYVKVDGSGDANYQYGIVMTGNSASTAGLSFSNYSTHVEASHIEINNPTGFAGIMAKTDRANSSTSGCAPVPSNQIFTFEGLSIHDNYIHNTGGEGMYIGETKTDACSHNLRNVRIYNNVIENTGYDGIQISNADQDVEVYGNTITGTGFTATADDQKNGFQIGYNTVGLYHNNTIVNSGSNAVIVLTDKNIEFYDNIVSGSGSRQTYSPNFQGFYIWSKCDNSIPSISCATTNTITVRNNTLSNFIGYYFNVSNPLPRTSVQINYNTNGASSTNFIRTPIPAGVTLVGNSAPSPVMTTVTIGLDENFIDGNNRPDIGPGTTICLAPGNRSNLQFVNLHGSSSDVITIKNCTGDGNYGLSLQSSTYVKLDLLIK